MMRNTKETAANRLHYRVDHKGIVGTAERIGDTLIPVTLSPEDAAAEIHTTFGQGNPRRISQVLKDMLRKSDTNGFEVTPNQDGKTVAIQRIRRSRDDSPDESGY